MIELILKNKYFKFIVLGFFILVFLFGRSFMGIYIFGFRIGELSMGLSLLFFAISYLTFYKNSFLDDLNKKIFFLIFSVINLTFIINAFIIDSSVSSYTFRSSSYIWTLGFLFFGYQFFKFNELNNNLIYIGLPILIYIYFFSIFGLPETVVEFILSISDKFEPHKGSDLLIIYITIFFVINRIFQNKRIGFEVFSLFSAVYFPLMLFKSRGSFIAFLIYFICEVIYFKSVIRSGFRRNILLVVLMLLLILQSVFFISGSGFIKTDEIESEVEYVATYRSDPDEEVFRLFYIAEDILGSKTTRIFSTDNNLNWRLQIWQDVIYDLYFENQLLFGYGYDEKIPAMEDPTRKGQDGLNENVHNYIITLLARGGLITVALYLSLYFLIIKTYRIGTNSNYLLIYLAPVLFVTLFDVAMENSHFPLILYFSLGMYFHKNKIFTNY
ncbi:MAG: hypothetical protein CL470_08885 [Acidimicrobiaceae bacterium]|nr:hypothetical protein [Acidimicrobiaceae bacterium]